MSQVKDSSVLSESKSNDSSGNELYKILTNRKNNGRSYTRDDKENLYDSFDLSLIKNLLKRNVSFEKDKITEAIKQEYKEQPGSHILYTIRFNLLLLDRAFREMLLEEDLTDDEFLIIYHQIPIFKQVVSDIAASCTDLLMHSSIKILLYGYKISTCIYNNTEATVFLQADDEDTISFHNNVWYELDKDAVTSELYASILDKAKNKTKLTVEEHGALIEYLTRGNFLLEDYSRDLGLNARYQKIKADLVISLDNECPSLIKDIWGEVFDYIPTNFVTKSIKEDSIHF